MTNSIKVLLLAITCLLIVSIPPVFPEQLPQHKVILKSGQVIKCDRTWLSSEDIVRCKMGGSERLYSTDEIDLEKTFGESAAGTVTKQRKDREEDKEFFHPMIKKTKSGIGVTLGVGKLNGYTKYQIGGTVDSPSGSTQVHFPISELDFPLDVYMVSAGVSRESQGKWKFGLDVKKNITGDAGKVKDSDWGAYYLEGYEWAEQNTLDIYSESDADLEALIIDINLQYIFYRKSVLSLSGGLGYMYQNFNFELSNLDQWYPSSYYYFGEDLGHEYTSGKIGTYNVIYSIPYLEIATELNIKNKFSIEGSFGYAPLAHVTDEDHHILRYLVFKGDLYGDAVIIALEGRYNITERWFLTIHYSKAAVDADGTSKAYFFGFIYDHTIDQTIKSEQTNTGLSIGYLF